MEAKHERVEKPLKKIFINNFVGGIAWFFGATVGAVIILSILSFLLSRVDLVPILGDFVGQITQSALQRNPQLVQ